MDRMLVNILGYGVDTFSQDQVVDYIFESGGQIVTINPEMIMYAGKNPEFSSIINNAEIVVADGVGVQLGLKILGHNITRIPGIDLGKELVKRAKYLNKTVALVGSTQYVIENAVVNLKEQFPQLNIVYYENGFFDDKQSVYDKLIEHAPDLVLVALGSPKQENFIYELKSKLPHTVFIGLGGSFDVWAGTVKRAPVLLRRMGLEWLYRLLSEPKRIKRIFPVLPLFLIKVIKERISKK